MGKIKETILELKHHVYNAEDMIDSCYCSDDPDYAEFVEINTRYDKLLKDMNELVTIIDTANLKKYD